MSSERLHASPVPTFSSRTAPLASTPLDRWALTRIRQMVTDARVRFQLWDGFESPSTSGAPLGTIVFKNRRALFSWVWDPDLNFGETYMFGAVDLRGDLVAMLHEIYRALGPATPRPWWYPRRPNGGPCPKNRPPTHAGTHQGKPVNALVQQFHPWPLRRFPIPKKPSIATLPHSVKVVLKLPGAGFVRSDQSGVAQQVARSLSKIATVSEFEWKKLQRLPIGAITAFAVDNSQVFYKQIFASCFVPLQIIGTEVALHFHY